MHPEYLADGSVDRAQDERLRALLSLCFTKPHDAVFKDRRYFLEPYSHRWVIKDRDGVIIAHTGVHDKKVTADGDDFRIAGIAEVCVHPDHRGRGHVRQLLASVDAWATSAEFSFAVLFGDPKIYTSSGYQLVGNLLYDVTAPDGSRTRKSLSAMVKPLTTTPWPAGEVFLPGPTF